MQSWISAGTRVGYIACQAESGLHVLSEALWQFDSSLEWEGHHGFTGLTI